MSGRRMDETMEEIDWRQSRRFGVGGEVDTEVDNAGGENGGDNGEDGY
jgi:hypothetical protein